MSLTATQNLLGFDLLGVQNPLQTCWVKRKFNWC